MAAEDTSSADWRARAVQIQHMREQGMTYAQIGKHFGISRQRAHQLFSRLGLVLVFHCTRCGVQLDKRERELCARCAAERQREKARLARRKRVAEWRRNGLCLSCGRRREDETSTRCRACREKDREWRQQDYRYRLDRGLCTLSGCPNRARPGGKYCWDHLLATRRRQDRLRQERERLAAAAGRS